MSALKELRTKYGLTQRELSVRSGVTERTIARIEINNDYSPRKETLVALANVLSGSVDEILGRNIPTSDGGDAA